MTFTSLRVFMVSHCITSRSLLRSVVTSFRAASIPVANLRARTVSSMTVARVSAPFGRWESPISVDLLTGSSISITDLRAHGKNDLYFLESRPYESGRTVIVKMDGEGQMSDIVSKSANVRSKVHEYGGCGFSVDKGPLAQGLVYSENEDSRLYYVKALDRPSEVEALTPADAPLRFASFEFHPQLPLLVAVCEDHTRDTPAEVQNYIVLINLRDKSMKTLARGSDFYSNPTFSPAGNKLIWKEWSHPEMPWTLSSLFIADFDQNQTSISNVRKIAGGSRSDRSAVSQPQFTQDGTLVFSSDATGYHQLYRCSAPYGTSTLLAKPIEGEFSGNDWSFGQASYAIIPGKEEVIASYTSDKGLTLLARIGLKSGVLEPVAHPFLTISAIEANPAFPELIYVIGSTPKAAGLFSFYASNGDLKVLKSTLSPGSEIDEHYMSLAQPVKIPISESRNTFGFYYPPTSPTHRGVDGTKPPLLMRVHGGPSSFAPPVTSLQISYWTSRGYAFFALNYGGSSGFGRNYMLSLNSNWGVVDCEDALAAAEYLSKNGLCDASKMAIDGGSAGGYTVLNVLCHSTVFAAGCSLYGISELTALGKDTHKFESQYLFNLIGGTPDEIPSVYRDRSPLYHASNIQTPVMVQQGVEDRVVPINQARGMVEEIEKSGGTVELLVFEGEGHGFRGEKAQRESLEGETQFFAKYLKL